MRGMGNGYHMTLSSVALSVCSILPRIPVKQDTGMRAFIADINFLDTGYVQSKFPSTLSFLLQTLLMTPYSSAPP